MKVLFLDIDGVLNNHATIEKSPDGYTGIEDALVERLANIVKELDLTIVLTSTWKKDWSNDWRNNKPDGQYLDAKMAKYDIEILDKTFGTSESRRGTGIRNYLSHHKVEAYVIVDDHDFSDFIGELTKHFVMTDPATGLSDTDVNAIRKIILKGDK